MGNKLLNPCLYLKKRGPRIRYVAFSLLAFADNRSPVLEDIMSKCCDWLQHAKNGDNGWGTERCQSPSELFPTFLAIWALQAAGYSEDKIEPSLHWLLSRSTSDGWCIQPSHGPSYVATAYALLCLEASKYKDDEKVKRGRDFLLQIKQWSVEEEVIAGTVWKHCPYAWTVPALVNFDVDPYATVIAEGIRYINSMKANSGGWVETHLPEGKTVRAQYWAVMALNAVYRSFDPAVHVPRIDANQAQSVLSEPEYVKIAIRKRWATIIPSKLYRSFVYALMVVAFVFLTGAYRSLTSLPQKADSIITICLLAAAYYLIHKRHRQFPKMAKWVEWIVGALAFVDLVLGIHLEMILDFLTHIVERIKITW
jgi:hypothetical protein